MKLQPWSARLVRCMRRGVWVLPLAALAALVFGINEAAYQRSTRSLEQLGQRAEARAQIQLLRRALIDAEAGQRGYLLGGGRPEHLLPYQQAAATARSALDWLGRYYAGDAQAEAVFSAMAEQALGKLSELATTLDLQAKGRDQAWRELMLTDIGREKMDGLRQGARQLLQIEDARVAEERDDIVGTLLRGRFGVDAMMALSLLALWLFLRRTLALERTQGDQAAALQAQRDRLDAEVSRRTADLAGLARHLQAVREDEKSRLARELHDELGALLTAVKLDAARLKRAIGTIPPDIDARLQHLNESINRSIELKRHIIEELRPSALSNLGLTAALEILVREFSTRSPVQVTARLQAVALGEGAQITVYRLVQEALTNAAKHAAATRITLTLEASDHDVARTGRGSAHVVVQDDGCGFDPAQRRGTTHGLMGLRYRVEAEGGELKLHAAPGSGTRLEAWLPLAPPAEHADGLV